MPKPSEIGALVRSFTARLDRHIDTLASAHLAEVLGRMNVRGPTSPRPRKSLTTQRAADRVASSAARPVPPTPRSAPRSQSRTARPTFRPAAPVPTPPAHVVELPQRKQPTVIPPDFKITRLPPAQAPREKAYSELRSQCRVPGCLERNSGPRYDLMCRDHYAKLNTEERAKYKAMWKDGQR